jgi:hypothetical protein
MIVPVGILPASLAVTEVSTVTKYLPGTAYQVSSASRYSRHCVHEWRTFRLALADGAPLNQTSMEMIVRGRNSASSANSKTTCCAPACAVTTESTWTLEVEVA